MTRRLARPYRTAQPLGGPGASAVNVGGGLEDVAAAGRLSSAGCGVCDFRSRRARAKTGLRAVAAAVVGS
jgi:hypothetical protein